MLKSCGADSRAGQAREGCFPTVHRGVCGDNQKVGTETPKAAATEGTSGPRPKSNNACAQIRMPASMRPYEPVG